MTTFEIKLNFVKYLVMHIQQLQNLSITGDLSSNGGNGKRYGGGGAGGRIALYLQSNDTYLGHYFAHGGDVAANNQPAEPGGPGTVFIYHMVSLLCLVLVIYSKHFYTLFLEALILVI